MSEGFRPTWVDVDLDAIRHNARVLTPERVALMAVVKANGYGHGDVEVARAAIEAGATWVGVALVEEGLRLRGAGIEAPILVLLGAPGGFGGRRARPSADAYAVLRRRPRAPRRGRDGAGPGPREDRHGDAPRRRVATGGRRGVRTPGAGRRPRGGGSLHPLRRSPKTTRSRRRSSSSRFLEAADGVRGGRGDAPASCTRRTPAPRSCIRSRTSTSSGPGSRSTGSSRRPAWRAHLGLRPALSWRSRVSAVKRSRCGRGRLLRASLPARAGCVGRDRAGRLRGRLPSAVDEPGGGADPGTAAPRSRGRSRWTSCSWTAAMRRSGSARRSC